MPESAKPTVTVSVTTAQDVPAAGGPLNLSGKLLLHTVPLVLIATGLIGLNPVAMVALVGAIVPDPMALGVPPAVLAFSCMLGWGLAVTMTPMSSSAIITARWADVSPWTVTLRWNAYFTTSALLLAWLAIAAAFILWPR